MCIRDRYLPVKIENENYFDDTCLNNNNSLYDEKITDLIMNITTNGDWTEIYNVDLVYDYYGKMYELKVYGYYTQDKMCIRDRRITLHKHK